MRFNKILIYITTLAVCLLVGVSSGQDYLGYGEVSSSRTDDPGLAGMLQWLDRPVPSFPWYTTGGSFYSQPYTEATFNPYREYYATRGTTPTTGTTTTAGTAASGGIVSNPAKYDITGRAPSSVYYGTGVGLPYSQYASLSSRTNDLWIQGMTNWTQYAVVPVGTWLQLVAYVPAGGAAGFYQAIQTATPNMNYMTYQFSSGYNTMNYQASQVGRHMLYFVVNNQPSNVVVVDVFSQATTAAPTATAAPVTPVSLGTGTGASTVSSYNPPTGRTVNTLGRGTSAGSFVTMPRSSLAPNSYYPYGYYPYGLYPYVNYPFLNSTLNSTGYSTTTTPEGQIITTTNGRTTVTPIGQPTTISDGTYTTTIGPDGTQTTTSNSGGTTVTSSNGQTTTTSG